MKLAGSHIVLTGAAGGIGCALACELAARGAALLLVGRDAARVEALAATLPDARAVAADLTRAEGIERVRVAAQDFGANGLVNNAGQAAFGRFAQATPAQIASVVATNLIAPMQLTQALLPQLLAAGEAFVLNVGSAVGRIGLPGQAIYGASKFGLHGFSQALRRELAGTCVRVLHCSPRATDTGFNDAAARAHQRATRTPVDDPSHVARAIARQIERGTPERTLGFPERLAVRINGALPAALDGVLAAQARALDPSGVRAEPMNPSEEVRP
ncbi:SDR family oxidoreductase [Caldimonas sp. KR1-144]|uniref:SDR family oxidoreductase n=1 Tax=Caldimonas sp. KR1-144 TaxID=3400911 RepID=UPI003C0D7BD1